ncbi:HAMP domain-containing sensor histidine kinase [Aliivibrio kagoshimensis]|uniref:HAMP domain-containing sensor histidine kinase n=1 Tax=Aliivibrio kagoshimensis TaxID=2910230 RepID=UPI003D09FCF7
MDMPPYLKPFVAWATEWRGNNPTTSSILRITRIYTGLLLFVVGILLWMLYQLSVGQFSRDLTNQMSESLNQQVQLAKQLDSSDFVQQFTSYADSSRQFILAAATKDRVYGQLGSFPKNMQLCPSLTRFPIWLEKYNEIQLVSGCTTESSQGTLLIATDDESLHELKGSFTRASIAALIVTLAFGLITGHFFSRQILRRINTFNAIAHKVELGELTARVPISARNDEYDDMAQHINTMLSQLEDSFHAISGVTDAIAHDLRTPLGHLRQQIEHVYLHAQQAQVDPEDLADMLIKLDEILTTFTAMLELTRLENNQLSVNFVEVDLRILSQDALELVEPIAEENHQQLINIGELNPVISGDPTLLFRVMYNLLENATKYAGDSASISLELTQTGFMISDNGVGISDQDKEKVFQRLFRVEKSRNIAGYGIGLSIVRAIVRLHGGEVTLQDNNPGLKVIIDFKD